VFILSILRIIRGYVRFSAKGVFVERFLNLAARAHIPLWGTKKKGETMLAYAYRKDYDRLRKPAENTGTQLALEKEYGIPMFLSRYKKRAGLAIGIFVFALFILAMSRFIWSIEVVGNELVSTEEIIELLELEGLKVGSYTNHINVDRVEQNLLIQMEDLSWAGITIDGTDAIVEVRERTQPPELIDINSPCNIIAAKSGVIIKLEVYDGQPEVEEGDTVMEGDMIVNAFITNKKGSSTLNHARATVIARITESYTFEVPLKEVVREYTGQTLEKKWVGLFGLEVPLSFQEVGYQAYEEKTDSKPLRIFGMSMPFTVVDRSYAEYKEITVTYNEAEAEARAIALMEEFEKDNLAGCEIVSKDASGRIENGVYIYVVDFTYDEDIGVEQAVLTEQTE